MFTRKRVFTLITIVCLGSRLFAHFEVIIADDLYSASFHIPIEIGAPDGVLSNDADPNVVIEVQGVAIGGPVATNENGTVEMKADGSFYYNPPVNFIGADVFVYTAKDNMGGSYMSPVKIDVTGPPIWFVDGSNIVGANLGTFEDPFKSISDFNSSSSPDVNDYISVASGMFSESNGFDLQNGQTLIGQGVALISHYSADINSLSAYQSYASASGNHPIIVTTAVTSHGILLQSNNTIRGIVISNTTGYAMSGTHVGSLTVSNTDIIGNGGAINVSGSGNFSNQVNFGELSSNNAYLRGIRLQNVTGTLGIVTGTITNPVRQAIWLNGGSVNLTYPGTITKNTDITYKGIFIQNGHSGIINFDGQIILQGLSNIGIDILNCSGSYNFNGGFDIQTNGATAFRAIGGGNLFTDDPAGPVEADVQATNGKAIHLDGMTANTTIQFSDVTSTNSPTQGIYVNNLQGNFEITTDDDISISNPAGDAIFLSNSSADFDFFDNVFSGTITIDQAGGNAVALDNLTGSATFMDLIIGSSATNTGGIEILSGNGLVDLHYSTFSHNGSEPVIKIANRSGGTVNFNDPITSTSTGLDIQNNVNNATINFNEKLTLSPGANVAVNLQNNAGANMNFNGGFDIQTNGATAFQAIGGGNLFTEDPAGSVEAGVQATNGKAIHLDGMTANAVIEFSDVSSTNSPTQGIYINNLQGMFQIATGDDVSISNPADDAIFLSNSSADFDFNISGGTITIDQAGRDAIICTNNSGLISFSDMTISNTVANPIQIIGSEVTFENLDAQN